MYAESTKNKQKELHNDKLTAQSDSYLGCYVSFMQL